MILEPIDAQSFAEARRALRRSPAACRPPQLLRLALLIGLALALFSLSQGRVFAAERISVTTQSSAA